MIHIIMMMRIFDMGLEGRWVEGGIGHDLLIRWGSGGGRGHHIRCSVRDGGGDRGSGRCSPFHRTTLGSNPFGKNGGFNRRNRNRHITMTRAT